MQIRLFLNTCGLKYPLTGMGWYTFHLKKELERHNAINQLIITREWQSYDGEIRKKQSFQWLKKMLQFYPGSYNLLHAYHNAIFYKKTKLFDENVVYHEPGYILRPYSGLKVCSIHDLSPIYYPQFHPRGRVKFLLKHLPLSISKADHIITGSYSIRDEIINTFKVAPVKITVIYHGIDSVFKVRQRVEVNPVLARYGLLGKFYILSVATLEPRKNLVRLLQAFAYLSESQRKQFPLVLIGTMGWGKELANLKKLMRRMISKGEMYYLDYVASYDLPYLYSGAYAFVYLSLYEGFGLPLLEALASGVPTLTSNVSSMPEVVGNAALLVNPIDVGAINYKLNQLLTDNTLREKLKRRGPIQAAKFSWKKCADKTVKVYQSLLTSSS